LARHRHHKAAAAGSGGTSGGGGDAGTESAEAAFAAAQSCMDLFLSRRRSCDLDAVINYLPDTVIDRLIERKRAKRCGCRAACVLVCCRLLLLLPCAECSSRYLLP
jgi:hypothetical protein